MIPFDFQSVGDYCYLWETLKLKYDLVQQLKRMNDSYPQSHADYDTHFLFLLAKAVFAKKELKSCSSSSSLVKFDKQRLKLVKGSFHDSFSPSYIL